jgi:hypothetical protein
MSGMLSRGTLALALASGDQRSVAVMQVSEGDASIGAQAKQQVTGRADTSISAEHSKLWTS